MSNSQLLTETLHKHANAIELAVHSGDEIKVAETLKGVSKGVLQQLAHHNLGYSGGEHKAVKCIKKELADRSNAKKITKESVDLTEVSHEKVRAYLKRAKDNLFYNKERKNLDSINDLNRKTKRSDRSKKITDHIIKSRTTGINMANKRLGD